MAEYQFKGESNALPYDAFGFCVLRKRIDWPAMIATDFNKLALSSAPTVGLTSFAGFVAADILNVFHIPKGTWVLSGGIRISTPGTSSVTGELGIGGNTAALVATGSDLNAAADTVYYTVNDDAYGGDYFQGFPFNAADTIDLLGAGATDILGIYDVWAVCAKVW